MAPPGWIGPRVSLLMNDVDRLALGPARDPPRALGPAARQRQRADPRLQVGDTLVRHVAKEPAQHRDARVELFKRCGGALRGFPLYCDVAEEPVDGHPSMVEPSTGTHGSDGLGEG